MTTEAITFSTCIQKLDTRYKTFTKPNYMRRLRYAIEHSDWDEEILAQDEWLEKICLGVITAASLFISTVLIMFFLR